MEGAQSLFYSRSSEALVGGTLSLPMEPACQGLSGTEGGKLPSFFLAPVALLWPGLALQELATSDAFGDGSGEETWGNL